MVHHCGFKECKSYNSLSELLSHIRLVHKAPRNPNKRRKLRHTSEFARLIEVAANALREFNSEHTLSASEHVAKITERFMFVPVKTLDD